MLEDGERGRAFFFPPFKDEIESAGGMRKNVLFSVSMIKNCLRRILAKKPPRHAVDPRNAQVCV